MSGAEPIITASDEVLILVPDRNSPPKRDFDNVFWPEATTIQKHLGGPTRATIEKIEVPAVDPNTLTITGSAKQRGFERAARQCVSVIGRRSWTHIVILCHGWSTGFQLGFRVKGQKGTDEANLAALVAELRKQRKKGLKTITLFACSAGDEPGSKKTSPGTGDRSMADYLRDHVGCTVIAHWTTGHSTRNPDLILFEASDVPLVGGVAYPKRGTAAYRNAVKLLTNRGPKRKRKASGDLPPKGHSRPAFTSIPLCQTVHDLQALLSSKPAF